MASIYKEFEVNASPQFVWEAIKDWGAVHIRLAPGFVVNTTLADDIRTVTFANGLVIQEQMVAIDEARRRFVYRSVAGRASHHNAFFQVVATEDVADADRKSRVLWVADLLPDTMLSPIGQMMEQGANVIQRTLEASFRAARHGQR